MEQKIKAFHQDEETRILCDEMGQQVATVLLAKCKEALITSYEEAGISGLCAEGRWEVAISALDSLPIKEIVKTALGDPLQK